MTSVLIWSSVRVLSFQQTIGGKYNCWLTYILHILKKTKQYFYLTYACTCNCNDIRHKSCLTQIKTAIQNQI